MHFESVQLIHFRNYARAEVPLAPGLCLLLGDNGQGKTNLLEAVYLLGNLRSFRTHRLEQLIRWSTPGAEAHGALATPAGRETLSVHLTAASRRVLLDGRPVGRATEFIRRTRVIAFSPDDLFLLRDHSEERRRFLDRALFHVHPAYGEALTEYGRALRQRNALLRALRERPAPDSLRQMDIWDEMMARWGAEIRRARSEYLETLSETAGRRWRELSARSSAVRLVPVETGAGGESARLLETLQHRRAVDLSRGFTTCGPHRDDMEWSVDHRPARETLSQGQFRLFVLALKLAEAEMHMTITGTRPILLFDDVAAELDRAHRDRLGGCLADSSQGQVLATSCENAGWPRTAGRVFIHAGNATGSPSMAVGGR
ncbi:MAG: DNA replication/repair protein RecF [Nitrospirota bacterium]